MLWAFFFYKGIFMEKELMIFEDGSEDKDHFTIIPNYIGNHSTATDQALYFQIKKHAGVNNECFVSKRTLMKKLGIGKKLLNKSLKYLISMGWIGKVGEKTFQTEGGPQKVTVYKTASIWKLNSDYYSDKTKGGANRPTLPKGGSERAQGGVNGVSKGGANSPLHIYPENNIRKDKKEGEGRFAPPSFDEVSKYCFERKNNINACQFLDFYESKGWMIGKNKMKDWRAAVRTWEVRQKEGPPEKKKEKINWL